MRSLNIPLLLVLFNSMLIGRLHGQGLLILNAATNDLMPLDSSGVSITIEDQVAIVQSTQTFHNTSNDTVYPKYAYPLPEAASATRLRWLIDGAWHTASMVAQPPDTTLPGSGPGEGGQTALQLQEYLGATPLYFRMLQGIPPGAQIAIELSYVELLPYGNARVQLLAGSDQSAVMAGPIGRLTIDAHVRSQRALTGIDMLGTGDWDPTGYTTFVEPDSAWLHVTATNVQADHAFTIGYDLDPLGYGLISMSNYLPDSLVKCDELGNGFFVLLIEPQPTSDVIAKDLVIVIDKSGSMSGTKISEARDAASYMVNNLNIGDQFNVIVFDYDAASWSTGLQPYTAATMTSALNWISSIQAGGGTNINSAITLGINNYQTSPPDHARPLVFLTDGVDSQSNSVILNNASQLRQQIAPDLQLFTFGIGEGFNEQLLNQLAVQNNGVSQFLAATNFAQVMGDFYQQIQDPVLISPTATFDRPDVQNIHPLPLMGLFVGQQLAIVGRYDEPGPVELHLAGTASGQPVVFNYVIDLTGTYEEDRSFVPKVWAQKAINSLLNEYYAAPVGSPLAQQLQDSIANYSMCYGISSPFTSFTDPGTGGTLVGEEELALDEPERALVFPEPSAMGTPVTFDLARFAPGAHVRLRIMDISGRLVMEKDLSGSAGTTWVWDGLDASGQPVRGQFLFQLISGDQLIVGRLTRL